MQSTMAELRQDSSQQSKSLRWIKIFLGVILVALALHSFIMIRGEIKEHSLSTELKEMKKMVEELSKRVVKTEKENENLRKDLLNTEVKLDNMLRGFPDFHIDGEEGH